VHPFQTFERLQVNSIVAHRKVRSFHKSKAEIAGKENVLEVGFVVRPRCQERDERCLTIGGRESRQPLLQGAKETREPLHTERAEEAPIKRCDDESVLHRIACTGGTLRPIGDNPPTAVWRTGQIATIKIEKSTAERVNPPAGP